MIFSLANEYISPPRFNLSTTLVAAATADSTPLRSVEDNNKRYSVLVEVKLAACGAIKKSDAIEAIAILVQARLESRLLLIWQSGDLDMVQVAALSKPESAKSDAVAIAVATTASLPKDKSSRISDDARIVITGALRQSVTDRP